MGCGFCRGEGVVSKELYEAWNKTRIGTRKAMADMASNQIDELKTWVCEQLDMIDWYGCESCWADMHREVVPVV